jgi:hypothetical protein
MNLNPFCLLILCGIFGFECVAQEKADTTNQKFPQQIMPYNSSLWEPSNSNNEQFFENPTLEQRITNMIFDVEAIPPSLLRYKTTFISPEWQMHDYTGKYFRFFSQSQPTTFGFDFQWQHAFGIERLNLYNFGEASFYHENTSPFEFANSPLPATRYLQWQAGCGFEYQVVPRTYLFYQQNFHFRNISPLGNSKHGGIRYKF